MSIITSTNEHFDQLQELLTNLEDWQYISPITSISEATIGQHVRHILECYQCFFDGISSSMVSYDNRTHDTSIEKNKQLALDQIALFRTNMIGLNHAAPLNLKASYSYSIYDESEIVDSTVGRELIHNLDHMIHHMALIKNGVASAFPLIKIHSNFGIAPSTIRYRTA